MFIQIYESLLANGLVIWSGESEDDINLDYVDIPYSKIKNLCWEIQYYIIENFPQYKEFTHTKLEILDI